MNGLIIKAICIMVMLTTVPMAAYFSDAYEKGLQEKATEALYQEYNENSDSEETDEEWTVTEEQIIAGEQEETEMNRESDGMTESPTFYEEGATSCVPVCPAKDSAYETLQDPLPEDDEEIITEVVPIAAEVQSTGTEFTEKVQSERVVFAPEEHISFDVNSVEYGDDKVWLSARVHNPTGAHITSAGFYATTPAGVHAGDEELCIDTEETEFEICFELEGFSNAVLMGPDYEFSFYVISNGEKIKSSEHEFRFEQ